MVAATRIWPTNLPWRWWRAATRSPTPLNRQIGPVSACAPTSRPCRAARLSSCLRSPCDRPPARMTASPGHDKHAEYNKQKLFLLSVIALATAGIGFSIRGDAAGAMKAHFFDPVDQLHSAEMIGSVLGILFMGFAVANAVGSPLLDYFGMGRLLGISGASFIVGNLIVLFA